MDAAPAINDHFVYIGSRTDGSSRCGVGDPRRDTEHGLRAVTMSQIAEQTGIGRATLYKYFLRRRHDHAGLARPADHHHLAEIREQADDSLQRVPAPR